MKNVVFAITLLMGGLVFGQSEKNQQKIKVPEAVKMAFQADFPKVRAHWGMEDGGYEAEFKMNGRDASAVYDSRGHKIAFEIAVERSEVPEEAWDYILKNYANTKITEIARISDDQNVVNYEVEIGMDGKSYDVLFDANGKFLKIVEGD